jgi:putative DNA primase/helicase
LPRLVMFAANNAAEGEDQPERIMVRVKSNISKSGGGFGYHIDAAPLNEHPDIQATRIVWELPLEGTARELLAEAEGQDADARVTKLEQAKKFLKTALNSGERRQTDIQAEAEALGICEKTLRRAAKEGVAKRKEGQGGPWLWRSQT